MYGFNTCMICGHTQKKGTLNNMKYKEYETDPESGRLKRCMCCDNEYVLGDYCHICGTPVVNYCSNATYEGPDDFFVHCRERNPLPSNARYCHHCGSQSTFLNAGLLKDYKTEKASLEFMDIPEDIPVDIDETIPLNDTPQNTWAPESDQMIIPDPIDEELPFY